MSLHVLFSRVFEKIIFSIDKNKCSTYRYSNNISLFPYVTGKAEKIDSSTSTVLSCLQILREFKRYFLYIFNFVFIQKSFIALAKISVQSSESLPKPERYTL